MTLEHFHANGGMKRHVVLDGKQCIPLALTMFASGTNMLRVCYPDYNGAVEANLSCFEFAEKVVT